MSTSNETTAGKPPIFRLIVGSIVGFFVGIFAAAITGIGASSIPAISGIAVEIAIAAFIVCAGFVAILIRDRGRIRLRTYSAGGPSLVSESEFENALRTLRAPPEQRQSAAPLLLFAATLGTFVWIEKSGGSLADALILAGVLMFHELGHWLAMKVFGYRDTKIFFIPFFGAAASGESEGVPVWQETIVLLMGPVPGTVIGLVLMLAGVAPKGTTLHTVALLLVVVNGFNLLPLEALDGGRILRRVISVRRPWLEAASTFAMSIAMLIVARHLHSIALGVVGSLGMLRILPGLKNAQTARAFRERWPAMPARLTDCPDDYVRELFAATATALGTRAKVEIRVPWMKSLHQRIVRRDLPRAAAAGLLFAYIATVGVTVVGFVVAVTEQARASTPTVAGQVVPAGLRDDDLVIVKAWSLPFEVPSGA